jgi:uncharacterized protein (TIGR02246 family)
MRVLIALSALALAACSPEPAKTAEAPPPPPPPPQMISEADAIALVDKIPAGILAKDPAAIVSLYADNAVLVDMQAPDLITTKQANLAATKGLTDGNPIHAAVNVRQVQILDADTFVVTEIVTVDLKPAAKVQSAVFRVTDVIEKKADGTWTIVNEHVSMMPTMPKTKLPVLVEWPKPADAAPAKPADAPAKTPAKPAETPAKPN